MGMARLLQAHAYLRQDTEQALLDFAKIMKLRGNSPIS
jgi:hypothetical protein